MPGEKGACFRFPFQDVPARPRRRHERGPNQNRLALPLRANCQIQPPACDRARIGQKGALRLSWNNATMSPPHRKISLNICRPAAIHNRVRRFRNMFFALAAFLWLPASAHCQLEIIPGFEFLACLTGSACHDSQSSDRSDKGCCSVEKSQYKTEQLRVTLPSPDLLPISLAPLLTPANSLPAKVCAGVLTAAPPQLLKTWHFASRTALPVRAPSITS